MQDHIWTLRPIKWKRVDLKTQSTTVTPKFSSVRLITSIKFQVFSKVCRTFHWTLRFSTPPRIILSVLRALAISSSWIESWIQQTWWLSLCFRNKMCLSIAQTAGIGRLKCVHSLNRCLILISGLSMGSSFLSIRTGYRLGISSISGLESLTGIIRRNNDLLSLSNI